MSTLKHSASLGMDHRSNIGLSYESAHDSCFVDVGKNVVGGNLGIFQSFLVLHLIILLPG